MPGPPPQLRSHPTAELPQGQPRPPLTPRVARLCPLPTPAHALPTPADAERALSQTVRADLHFTPRFWGNSNRSGARRTRPATVLARRAELRVSGRRLRRLTPGLVWGSAGLADRAFQLPRGGKARRSGVERRTRGTGQHQTVPEEQRAPD